MKETILLFGFSAEKQKKLLRGLLPLKMRIKKVETEQMGQPLGVVAGLWEAAGKEPSVMAETEREPETEQMLEREPETEQMPEQLPELEDEMLVMAGLTSARVDTVLLALRKAKVGPIPYKAVLTEANQQWNAYELLAELQKEHARFEAETP